MAFQAMLSSRPCSLPGHALFQAMLSSRPFSLPGHLSPGHSLSRPFSLPGHSRSAAILAPRPFSLPGHSLSAAVPYVPGPAILVARQKRPGSPPPPETPAALVSSSTSVRSIHRLVCVARAWSVRPTFHPSGKGDKTAQESAQRCRDRAAIAPHAFAFAVPVGDRLRRPIVDHNARRSINTIWVKIDVRPT